MTTTFHLENAKQIAPNTYVTAFEGMYYFNVQSYPDNRGFYTELAKLPEIEAITGQPFPVKQINHARSLPNVMRGFHAESWNKLVTVIQGQSFCALADVRPGSKTFGQVETLLLGPTEPALSGVLFVPNGVANSVCVVDGPVDYLYFVDQLYAERDPAGDVAISLFDSDLAVEWPLSKELMILSDRDRSAVSLRKRFPESFVA